MPLRVGRVVEFVVGTAGATAATSRSAGVRAGRGGDRSGPAELGSDEIARGAGLLLEAYDASLRPDVGEPWRVDLLQREWLARTCTGDEARIGAVRRTVRRWYPVEGAERLLADARDRDDLRSTAEALWLWPVLGLPWRPRATMAMRVLDLEFFARGHVPLTGSGCRHPLPDEGPEAGDRPGSRRATLAYGVLCAALWAQLAASSEVRPVDPPRLRVPQQHRLAVRRPS